MKLTNLDPTVVILLSESKHYLFREKKRQKWVGVGAKERGDQLEGLYSTFYPSSTPSLG